ncbi:DUF1189 domain-containing protein [Gottfriedia solisilvae]|uniref:DUF1189 domain-containing protein n=1 Tax=Gottfriedia solisilvae TaxID=1516104 RepID=A0A8J3AIQ0_9BACI|nr:DUF1189 domain-containing protein [Gottfriedia solisilvae]GGI11176.1 hypothetical protein GCM10007380_06510 [Gottfriedia solisilvae]
MNLFKQFWYSLYSPKTIAKFRLQKIGKTIFYLFLLAILYTLPGFFSFEKAVKLQVNNASDLLKENIQTISLNKGILTINDNKPFERKIGDFRYAFYPNETSLPSSTSKDKYSITVLKDRVVIKTDSGEQDYPYLSLDKTEINKEDISKFIKNVKQALPVFMIALFFLFYLGSCFFIFIVATILAFITALFHSDKNLTFRHRFAMIAYSLTLPTVIYFIVGLFNINIPFQTILFIIISAVMYSLTVKQLPSKR